MRLPMLKVPQWLKTWDNFEFKSEERREKPEPTNFFVFSMEARLLARLSDTHRRSSKRLRGNEDTGIQRRHQAERSEEIARYILKGFPMSGITKKQFDSGDFSDLEKPGWLPTAIVVNILKPTDARKARKVDPDDLLRISNSSGQPNLNVPDQTLKADWQPKSLAPIEIIDGQHRLLAFNESNLRDVKDFHFPVIAFYGLDLSWQAYLFYMINIKPKRIDQSLAYDLYPLLRSENWLEHVSGPAVYRETRAQELVDILFSYPSSPWYQRINMLGESGHRGKMLSQASWVRSLETCFFTKGNSQRPGGLFSEKVGLYDMPLPWSMTQQAAFIIYVGKSLHEEVTNSKNDWATALRSFPDPELELGEAVAVDPAWSGKSNLLNQDQGIRAVMSITNDLCVRAGRDISLDSLWTNSRIENLDDGEEALQQAVKELGKARLGRFVRLIAKELANFDWRSAIGPGLSEQEQLIRKAFRGSGGYTALRMEVEKSMRNPEISKYLPGKKG